MPPSIRLNTTIRQYAFRTFKLPEQHPIRLKSLNTQTSESVPTSPTSPTSQTSLSKATKRTQLERISDSISRFTHQYTEFESISHYYFAPWEKDTPYVVNIASLTKEEAAVVHTSTLDRFWGTNTTTIYTDASSIANDTSRGIGIGLVAKSFIKGPSTTTYKSTLNIGLGQLVYNSELEGATLAIKYANSIATRS